MGFLVANAENMQDAALKILVVEDNEDLREATLAVLQSRGHTVRGITMAEELGDVAGGFIPDIYIIDLNLPGEDGLSLTRRLKACHPDAGIVITTARSLIGDKVTGYESGADLYLSKPVHPQELLASLSALAKRLKRSDGAQDGLVLRVSRLQLSGPADTVELTPGDAAIISALAQAPDRSLDTWQIAEIMTQGDADAVSATTLQMRISRLRQKLAAAGAPSPGIKALHKRGYALCVSVILQ